MSTSPDYPAAPAARGRIEPSPRRVRGYYGSDLVFDTVAARYVWEVPYYPQYYIPLADVRTGALRDDDHPQRVQFGPSRLFSVVGAAGTAEAAARVFDAGEGPFSELVRFEWDVLTWFEEDEPIYGHPRNPYARIDALRSHRHITVTLGGVPLADTHAPVLLFETGLPTRYYIDRTDVRFSHLEPSNTQSLCPYKGVTSGYWSARVADTLHEDIAWTYNTPLPAVAPIANLIAFYNEKVDITVDGVALDRPRTQFSPPTGSGD
ncbi:DUF427 domain-containing protein [Mycobacterium sp. ACS4331]|uniref:DUF427 domain-containing protein n=1 Tax=Mycobacterium sp. ACS4331 TaxID=1834121 RepID=UPI0007FFFA2F|nr:DUF427 domain-containing protein [Mycobacterium sp. ACS4331]OBF20009.1 hypothetical protein A5727_09665 [Mycobacterium sp. ACS4331]